ncbi:MAG TPA: Asp-tRNA(Asn)/Glu-tRNA(Gln) amidotransferase subunit GatC [Trueperaceae bacterium]
MKISDEELGHLEKLARIEVPPQERESLRDDLSRILEYFETLGELDTEGVEEMVRPVHLENVLREDEVTGSLPREVVLELAVETSEEGFLKVPRTVDEDS